MKYKIPCSLKLSAAGETFEMSMIIYGGFEESRDSRWFVSVPVGLAGRI